MGRNDRRLLVVSPRFPPRGGGGVQRITYFVRHLTELGWEVTVLTGPGDASHGLEDRSLLAQVPASVQVIRTRALDTSRAMHALGRMHLASAARVVTPSFPNMEPGWIPFGLSAGAKALAETGARLILSSAYPLSSHIVALLLANRTGCRWVADYRDEWSIRSVLRWPTPLHRRVAIQLDRAIVRRADRVVTTSPAHTRRFVAELADGDSRRFVTITNGFDPEDFAGHLASRSLGENGRPFTIAHVGSLFTWRDGSVLVDAIGDLLREGSIGADEIRLRFVGHAAALPESAGELEGVIQRTGYVDHATAVREMRAADLLVLVNTEETNIPGKTFEYLASGTPILAMVRPGPTGEIVREARAGTVVDVDDREGTKRAIREGLSRWRAGSPVPAPDPGIVGRYARRATARQMSDVLDAVLADGRT
jgi:glycosyltransferase involved in cell wall biosynthesis